MNTSDRDKFTTVYMQLYMVKVNDNNQ